MPVYNINGNSAMVAYNYNGIRQPQVYDIQQNPLLPNLVVMTYNVGNFTGINAQQTMQDTIIAKYEPDIVSLQELMNNATLPTVGANMFEDYSYKQVSNHKNRLFMISKTITPSNVVIADFTNQDPLDASQWNETRAYMKGDIEVNGKTITWFNTHLCYLTQSVKWQQMQELYTMAQNCEYAILAGDFNSYPMTVESDEYINMYKPFVDAGYKVLNCSPAYGFTNTWTSSTTATSMADLTHPHDSIIVSGNITVVDVVLDTTKFNYVNGSEFDHIPVVAYLQV